MKTLSILAAAFGITIASLPAQAAAPAAVFDVRTAEALFDRQDFEVIRVQEGRTGLDAPISRSERRRIERERNRGFQSDRGFRSNRDFRTQQRFSRPSRVNKFKKGLLLKKALKF